MEITVHSQTKRYLLGEEALYGIPYQFSYQVNSKVAYLLEVYTEEMLKVAAAARIQEMKLDYRRRFSKVHNTEEKLR